MPAKQERASGTDLQKPLNVCQHLRVLDLCSVKFVAVRLEEKPNVLAKQRIHFKCAAGRRGPNGGDGNLLVLKRTIGLHRLERGEAEKAIAVGRVGNDCRPVREHGRVKNPAETPRGIECAGEKRDVFRAIAQMNFGQLYLRLGLVPVKRLCNEIEMLIGLSPHQRVAMQQSIDKPGDHLWIRLSKPAINNKYVGDDE